MKAFKSEENKQDIKYETKNTHIYIRKSSKVEAEKDQRNLLDNLVEFNNRSRPKNKKGKDKKKDTYDESAYALYEGRELTPNSFKSGIFPIKATQSEGLKILTPKQMLQRLPIAPTQVKQVTDLKNY